MNNIHYIINVPNWTLKAIFRNDFDGISEDRKKVLLEFMERTELSLDTTRIWYESGSIESGCCDVQLLNITTPDEYEFSSIGVQKDSDKTMVELKDNNDEQSL
jgi:hypothetical protein